MALPIDFTSLNIAIFLLMSGSVLVIAGAIGAVLHAWSWKVPRTLAMAFGGLIVLFLIINFIILLRSN